MRSYLRLGLAGLACGLLSTPALAADWQVVTNKTFGFAARFPAPPKLTQSTKDDVRNSLFVAAAGSICLVDVTDYAHKVDVDEELTSDRDNFAKGVDATVTSTSPVTFHRGSKQLRASEFDATNSAFDFRSMVITDGLRTYMITAGVRKDGGDRQDLDRCVRSLKLLAD